MVIMTSGSTNGVLAVNNYVMAAFLKDANVA